MIRGLHTVGVAGLGTMGAGIAEVFARGGMSVIGVEADQAALERGRGHITASTDRAVRRGRLSEADRDALVGRITFTTSYDDLSAVDLVVEAVPEIRELKQRIFAELDRVCPAEAILATNTSSLSVTEIAAATSNPARVVGVHFFNPAPVMKLVEVIRTVVAHPEVVATVETAMTDLGKTVVTVGDRAGFVANALLLPYLNHAVRMYETRHATRDEIDTGMREIAGLPMGPFALLDLIGLDTSLSVMEVLWAEFRHPRVVAAPLLRRMVAAGLLGRKSGRGFYPYDGAPDRDLVEPATPELREARGAGGEPVPAVLLAAHLDDAVRMRDEGYATETDIDTAMRLGCGYPQGPFALLAR